MKAAHKSTLTGLQEPASAGFWLWSSEAVGAWQALGVKLSISVTEEAMFCSEVIRTKGLAGRLFCILCISRKDSSCTGRQTLNDHKQNSVNSVCGIHPIALWKLWCWGSEIFTISLLGHICLWQRSLLAWSLLDAIFLFPKLSFRSSKGRAFTSQGEQFLRSADSCHSWADKKNVGGKQWGSRVFDVEASWICQSLVLTLPLLLNKVPFLQAWFADSSLLC